MAANRIFCCQGNTAQHDEDKDEIGKDVVIDESVASHSNSEEETQKYTMCANRIQQMANIQHVFYYSANSDRTEQPSAAKSSANAEDIALISKNVNSKSNPPVVKVDLPKESERGFLSSYWFSVGYECHYKFRWLYQCAYTEAKCQKDQHQIVSNFRAPGWFDSY